MPRAVALALSLALLASTGCARTILRVDARRDGGTPDAVVPPGPDASPCACVSDADCEPYGLVCVDGEASSAVVRCAAETETRADQTPRSPGTQEQGESPR